MLREAVDLYLENAEADNMLDELPGPFRARERYATMIEIETT